MKNNKVQTNKISLIVTIMIFIFSYQLSYAQHSITINKIDQSDCYSTGDIIEIYGTGFVSSIQSGQVTETQKSSYVHKINH